MRYFMPALALGAWVYLAAERGAAGVVIGLIVAAPFVFFAFHTAVVADDGGVAVTNIKTTRVTWNDLREVHVARESNGYYLRFRLHDGRDLMALATTTYFARQAARMRDQIVAAAPRSPPPQIS
jgi:hypothetical protein